MINLDTAATLGYTLFEPNIPMNYFNPNAVYINYESDKIIKDINNDILNALELPNGIVCLTYSASHSVEILSKIFNGVIQCCNSAHDSVYELSARRFREANDKWLDVYTPINNVTGDCEWYNGNTNNHRFVGYDCTATVGRYKITKDFWDNIDCAWGSGHKFGTPIGIGWLWLNDRMCKAFGFGETIKNNWGVFHGTMSVYNYRILKDAIINAQKDPYECNPVYELIETLRNNHIEYEIIGTPCCSTIVCLRIPGVNALVATNMMYQRGVTISPGASACTYEGDSSRVLKYYGCEHPDECIRVSFDPYADSLEILNQCTKFTIALKEVIKQIKGE